MTGCINTDPRLPRDKYLSKIINSFLGYSSLLVKPVDIVSTNKYTNRYCTRIANELILSGSDNGDVNNQRSPMLLDIYEYTLNVVI